MGFDFWLMEYSKSNQLVSFDDHEVIWKVNRYFSDMFSSANRWFEITYAFTQTKKIFSLDKKAAHIDHTRNFPPDSAISCLALCKLYNCHVDHHGSQTCFGVAFLLKGYMANFCRNYGLSSTMSPLGCLLTDSEVFKVHVF